MTVPDSPHSLPRVFSTRRRVAFCATDLAGVMHFSNYLRWMEDAEHAFWRSLGLSVHAPDAATPYSWPRVSVSCEYRAPLRFEDEAELRLRLVNLGGRSLTLEVEFLRARHNDGRLMRALAGREVRGHDDSAGDSRAPGAAAGSGRLIACVSWPGGGSVLPYGMTTTPALHADEQLVVHVFFLP